MGSDFVNTNQNTFTKHTHIGDHTNGVDLLSGWGHGCLCCWVALCGWLLCSVTGGGHGGPGGLQQYGWYQLVARAVSAKIGVGVLNYGCGPFDIRLLGLSGASCVASCCFCCFCVRNKLLALFGSGYLFAVCCGFLGWAKFVPGGVW